MARSSAPPSPSNRPQWLSTPIGRSESGAEIIDISPQTARINEFKLRLTIHFKDNYREPLRYYRVVYDGQNWICSTPRKPDVCQTVINWLEQKIGDPTAPSNPSI